MDKSKQPITNNSNVEFWQQRLGKTLQPIGLSRWLLLLVFLGMSAVTLLIWQGLLKNQSIQANNNFKQETSIKPQTGLQSSSAKPLLFAGFVQASQGAQILIDNNYLVVEEAVK